VHSAPLRALRTMPVDTRKITYAAGTQPASMFNTPFWAVPPQRQESNTRP
jgi:hypothetical protein